MKDKQKKERKVNIKLPNMSLVNYAGIFILAGLVASGMIILKNINKEYEIRLIAGKFQEFKYATLSFNNIYSGLPGDITNATFYWKDVTKDGNGNRKIEHITGEDIAAFQQLQLANLIRLSYTLTGKWQEGKEGVLLAEENSPANSGNSSIFFLSYVETFQQNMFGYAAIPMEAGIPQKAALTPDSAYMLDLMIDDGYPDRGNIVAVSGDSADDCFAVGEYKKESLQKECIVLFRL